MSDFAAGLRIADVNERWRRLEDLFAEASELPAGDRDAFVTRRCEGDPEMIARLRAMLDTTDDAPIVGAITAAVSELAGPPSAGARIGPYRLGPLIGQGGMGAVYRATRDDAEFTRDVAIKVLRPFASPDHVARFRDERQILATLEHPSIVRLLDGGRTDDGLPYLVMEHVDGVAITEFVRGRSVREVIELVARVAATVGHAHGKLVVHRDIKPSNILVEPDGTPKLLDFGIAKLLEGGREAPETRSGMALLTPEYASPEQARGERITVATDIYSLGAVCYELLTGRPPQSPGASVLETLTAICEREPARPGISPDLDSIVLKALQKRPADRYAGAADLVADLRAFLDGRPVAARAATAGYRAAKFVRRNAGALALATAITGALAVAAVVSFVQARRANESAQVADEQARRASESARIAEEERTRLVFERGHQELANGRAGAALPWLVRAVQATDGPAVRFLLAEALRPFERELAVLPFPGGAQQVTWFPGGERFAIWGAGGLAMFDREGRAVGAPAPGMVWDVAIAGGDIALAQDRAIVVLDLAGTVRRELAATSNARIAYTGDGTLVVIERDGRVRFARGALSTERRIGAEPMAVAAAGDAVAIGTIDKRLLLFDARGAQRAEVARAHDHGISGVAFLPGGGIVTASADGTAKLWTAGGAPVATLAGHNSLLEAFAVDREGRRVATGGRDGAAKVWSVEGRFLMGVRGHEFGVLGAEFSPDGASLLTTGGDGTHRIWDLAGDGGLVIQFEARVGGGAGPGGRAGAQTARYDATGTRVVAVGGNSAKLLRVDRGALLAELDTGRDRHQPRGAAYGPGDTEVVVVGIGGQLEIWDARAQRRVAVAEAGGAYLWDVAWSGGVIAVAGERRRGSLFDRATLRETRLVGHTDEVGRVRFDAAGSRLVTTSRDGTARLWDAATGRELGTLVHPASVSSAAWDRAGERVFTTCRDGTLRVWSVATRQVIARFEVGATYRDVTPSPDDRAVALAGHDGTIAIWDLVPEPRRRVVAHGHTRPATSVEWSPDGALLASSADDQTARIWDPTTGKVLATRRHRDGVMSVAWNAAGTAILTASTDGSARIWDAHRELRSPAELAALVARLVPSEAQLTGSQ